MNSQPLDDEACALPHSRHLLSSDGHLQRWLLVVLSFSLELDLLRLLRLHGLDGQLRLLALVLLELVVGEVVEHEPGKERLKVHSKARKTRTSFLNKGVGDL